MAFKFMQTIASALTFLLISHASVQACPSKIASVSGDEISEHAIIILQQVYKDIGCSPEFIALPGRRGILEFNKEKIDGELYRAPLAEQFYERPYVRSAIPLVELTQGVFARPDTPDYQHIPIGYVSGIKWHDLFVQNKSYDTERFVRFNSTKQLFAAFNKGQIKGFLSSTLAVAIHAKEIEFTYPAQLTLLIGKLQLYHYLGSEFADTMDIFSTYLKSHKPFERLTQ